jgi:hypothetical protein
MLLKWADLRQGVAPWWDNVGWDRRVRLKSKAKFGSRNVSGGAVVQLALVW